MDDRRNDLGLTWDDVASLSGLSRQTLYDIRKGNTDYRRMRSSTKRKIEKALQWERGSVDAVILHGQHPVAASSGESRPSRPDPDEPPPGWSEEEERLYQEKHPILHPMLLTQGLELTRKSFRQMRGDASKLRALEQFTQRMRSNEDSNSSPS